MNPQLQIFSGMKWEKFKGEKLAYLSCARKQIVHQKTSAALCLTTVRNEDKMEFSRISEAIKANFNDKYEEYRKK
ncbi:large ribosomal subunit protein eL8y-like [Rutidosis leptorrhynchoides]|uniref:large ribosomal subunit protein eL8y-like n=1 Tax=Rutidosis leptorrhynchoides TaxID=125765 RepID=UPI003A99E215